MNGKEKHPLPLPLPPCSGTPKTGGKIAESQSKNTEHWTRGLPVNSMSIFATGETILSKKGIIVMNVDIAEQVSAYIAELESIPDGDQTIVLYSTGLWLREKFGLSHQLLYETLSEANQKCVSRLSNASVALIGWWVDETPRGSHIEHFNLFYREIMGAEEAPADSN